MATPPGALKRAEGPWQIKRKERSRVRSRGGCRLAAGQRHPVWPEWVWDGEAFTRG